MDKQTTPNNELLSAPPKLAVEQLPQEQPVLTELKDIELPVSPAFDWLGFVQVSISVVLVVVLLALLIFAVRYSPLFRRGLFNAPFVLRWQLWQLKKAYAPIDGVIMAAEHTRPLYDWSERLFYTISQIEDGGDQQESNLLDDAANLKTLCEYMAFSNEPVSRETYYEAIQNAQIILNKALSFRFVMRCLTAGLLKRVLRRGQS